MRCRKWMVFAVLIGIIIVFALHIYTQEQKQTNGQFEYIRFHVIANSDSQEDQELKLRVRNLLLERFRDEFAQVNSIDESRRLIKKNLAEIEDIALKEVQRSGKKYNVQAQLGNFNFPTKAYGNLVLPAGEYEALRVVLGEGSGANWWCVMFPPLCFVDITHGVAKEQSEDSDGVKPCLVYQEEGVRVEYRFKIVEWWHRFLSFLNKLKMKLKSSFAAFFYCKKGIFSLV